MYVNRFAANGYDVSETDGSRPVESHSGARGKHSRGALSQSHSNWNIQPTFDRENFPRPSPSRRACLSPLVSWMLGGGQALKARELRRRTWPKAPRRLGIPSPLKKGSGEGAMTLPRKFLDFWVENGAFWCILGAIYADCSNLELYGLLPAHQRCAAQLSDGGAPKCCGPGETSPFPSPLDGPAVEVWLLLCLNWQLSWRRYASSSTPRWYAKTPITCRRFSPAYSTILTPSAATSLG